MEEKEINHKNDKLLRDLFAKEEVKIIVTDIGLGGMSVFDHIANRLSLKSKQNQSLPFRKVDLIFWNSQVPDCYVMHSLQVQVRKFDKQLNMMNNIHNPDIILIACNTLSSLYNKTNFYSTTQIPILSITEFGVKLFVEKLLMNKKDNEDCIFCIYGTETTVKTGQHKKLMSLDKNIMERKIDVDKHLILQGCKSIAVSIQEKGANSNEVKILIDLYVNASCQQITDNKIPLNSNTKIYAGLCCTHYGYASVVWLDSLKKCTKKFSTLMEPDEKKICGNYVEIINPNESMATFITDNATLSQNKLRGKIILKLSVFSPNVLLQKNERESIARLLNPHSAKVLLECKGSGCMKSYQTF
eukprot:223847_1